jgi:hypothetical protein
MNNNKQDAGALEAHCKGVFQKTGYITIGSAECVAGARAPAAHLPAGTACTHAPRVLHQARTTPAARLHHALHT